MALSSTKRKEQRRPIDALAFQHANAADFGLALDLLKDDDGPEALLLEARVALRISDMKRAVKALNRLHGATATQEQLAAILRSVATARLSPTYRAVVIPENASESNRLLALYYRGSHEAKHGFWAESRKSAAQVAASDDPGIRCLGLLLQAYNDVHAQAFDEALSRFESAYEALEANGENDEAVRSEIAFGIASLASETLDSSRFQFAIDILTTLKPTKWTNRRVADALSYGAQIFDLMGEPEKAYEMLLRSRSVAPEESLRLASIEIDLASFMERHRAPLVAAIHRANAKRLLFSNSWATADIDDRVVLLDYVVESHAAEHQSSSKALTLALSREGKRDIKLLLEHDSRAAILADYAKGMLLADRNSSQSADLIFDCQSRWLAIGYKRRALEAGLSLLRMGQSRGHDVVDRMLRLVPKSTQRQIVKTIKSHPSLALSAAELKVVSCICEGLTSREIAEKLNKSPYTIRNQTISVYRRLGVGSRAALVSLMKDAGVA